MTTKNNFRSNDYYIDLFKDNGNGAIRTSRPKSLFENRFTFNTSPILFEELYDVGGTISHLPNEHGIQLAIDTTTNARSTYQSKLYVPYTPAETNKFSVGILFGTTGSGIAKRSGLFDNNNGLYWEYTADGIYVCRRSKASGSVVDYKVHQTNWNIDKMDGKGPSQINLDFTKIQMLFCEYSWYGAGYIMFGVQFHKKIHPVHIFSAGNEIAEPIFGSPILPVRYEIISTGSNAADSFKIFGGSASSEGFDSEPTEFTATANNGTSAIAVTTRRAVLSIRPKTTFNSITNRALITPISVDIIANTNGALIELIKTPTLTGASFASVSNTSVVEYDVAATTITDGRVVESFYVNAGQGNRGDASVILLDLLPIGLTGVNADVQEIFTVAATSLSGTSNISAAINWKELQ